jgi:TetR/AcrR family transcriptional regulator
VPKADSRELLLRAARAEFAERGFAGARVDRIARASGLNKQLIYYYFGSKQALHAAATTAPASPNAAPPRDPTTSTDAIRQVVSGVLRTFADHPEIVALLVDRNAAPDGDHAGRAWVARAQRDAVAAVSRGQGLGYFRDDLDPELVARAAVVLCLGYLALAPHLDAPLDDWIRQVCDLLVRVTAW